MAKTPRRRKSGSARRNPLAVLLLVIIAAAVTVWQQPDLLESFFDFGSPAPQNQSHDSTATEVVLPQADMLMEAHFIDVGQGDSELIRIPYERGYFNILIDVGEYKNADSLISYLQNQNIEKLDVVVATHPHADHMGAMAKVIQTFAIGEFYMPRLADDQTPTTKAYETMLDALLEKNVSTHEIAVGTTIQTPDGTSIEVLAPQKDFHYDDINDYSAVIKLTYGETSFLFTGDAEKESEEQMLALPSDLKAQVLKVGHHGSSSSTTEAFLQAVSPQYAVISCETGNSYGHPHRETMEVLEKYQTEILRTDTMQTIVIKSDGKNLTVQTGLASAR